MLTHIAYRYEIFEILGKGSFGSVHKAYDHKRKEFCAIKIIKNKKKFHNQALIEVNILNYMKARDQENNTNIIKIKDFFIFRRHAVII